MGSLEYAADLFDHSTAERFVAQLLTLLEGCVASPDAPLATLPLLPDDEARLVRDVFPHGRLPETLPQPNITAAAHIVPEGALLHELFLAQVARTPEAVALIWPGDEVPSTTDATSSDPPATLTYRDLQASAQRLAHALSANGVRQGDLVGLCTPRSPSMVAGVLGILLAGAAYVPLDPSYPSARLAYLLDDARPRVLLAHRAAASQLPPLPSGTSLLWLDDLLASSPLDTLSPLEDSPPFALPSDPERDQRVAYVIYTSGSTGLPKGVAATHRGAVNRIAWMWQRDPFDAGEVCCLKTTLSFVDSVWELLGPLLQGVPLLLTPNGLDKDVSRFVDLMGAQQVTRLVVVPSLLQAMLEAAGANNRLPSLKICICSGEELSRELALSFASHYRTARLLNLYGSSEVAADATWYEVDQSIATSVRSIPIGRPLSGVSGYVLDQELRPCPIGMPGELYIGGPGIARGYLRRPALTAERFVPHPFSTLPGARLYKTGDRARWLPDGNLEYLGRLDRQVKIRGHRIELGEVEATLRHLPGVADAAVIATPGPGSAPEDASPSSDLRLVAYVVPSHPGSVSSDETLTPDSLRSGLAHNMPAYLLPAAIIILDSLPLTPNGKLDRNALPEPQWGHVAILIRSGGQADAAPRSTTEEAIADLWAEVLGLDRVDIGIHDDFFSLGGHSLLASKVISRVRNQFHVDIPLRPLFERPTISALAEVVDQARTSSATTSAPPIPALPRVFRRPTE